MFWRIRRIWQFLRRDGRLLLQAFQHPSCPWWFRLSVLLIAAYLLSPIDIVPDWLIFLGWLDDALILGWGVRTLLRHLPAPLRLELQSQTR